MNWKWSSAAAVLLLLPTLFLARQQSFKEEQIRELRTELTELKESHAACSELLLLAGEGKLGYAGENFRTDKSVVVLPCGGTEELRLTAWWEERSSVFVDCRGDSAELRFMEEDWAEDTVVSVKGIHPGLTVAQFSSDGTEDSFHVWILVEEET